MNITGGKYKGIKIYSPDEKIVRPTLSKIRMSVFNSLFSEFSEFTQKRFLDMFGGSGIMGLEALSRGFKEVIVFEKDSRAADIIRKNYEILGVKAKLYIGNSLSLIKNQSEKFDVIYIDPPYKSGIYEECLSVLPECGIIIIEHGYPINTNGFKIIKHKKFGSVNITFLKKNSL